MIGRVDGSVETRTLGCRDAKINSGLFLRNGGKTSIGRTSEPDADDVSI
jgi:hypothetical protein